MNIRRRVQYAHQSQQVGECRVAKRHRLRIEHLHGGTTGSDVYVPTADGDTALAPESRQFDLARRSRNRIFDQRAREAEPPVFPEFRAACLESVQKAGRHVRESDRLEDPERCVHDTVRFAGR
ncbi:MAG: hypothetical protein AAF458_03265 [Pseudomonadota bacterium]